MTVSTANRRSPNRIALNILIGCPVRSRADANSAAGRRGKMTAMGSYRSSFTTSHGTPAVGSRRSSTARGEEALACLKEAFKIG